MRVITFARHEATLAERRAALGLDRPDAVARNSGLCRTPEKRALLAALRRRADEAGTPPSFFANV